jgi:hypothetical protein
MGTNNRSVMVSVHGKLVRYHPVTVVTCNLTQLNFSLFFDYNGLKPCGLYDRTPWVDWLVAGPLPTLDNTTETNAWPSKVILKFNTQEHTLLKIIFMASKFLDYAR